MEQAAKLKGFDQRSGVWSGWEKLSLYQHHCQSLKFCIHFIYLCTGCIYDRLKIITQICKYYKVTTLSDVLWTDLHVTEWHCQNCRNNLTSYQEGNKIWIQDKPTIRLHVAVLIKMLLVPKKLSTMYDTWRFITMSTGACHFTLSSARSVQNLLP